MKKLLVACIVLLLVSTTTYSQLKKTMYLDKIDTICTDTKVDFNVRANNFTNIIGFQGSIGWDSSIVHFDSLMFGTNTGTINLNDSNTNIQPASSYLNFVWFDSMSHNLANNTILFTLRFSITNPKGNRTPVYFNHNGPFTSLEIDTLNLGTYMPESATDTSFVDGYIGFVDTPKIIQNGNVFTCIASCNPSGFQWYINGIAISGATNSTITIVGTGSYTVSVSYSNGNKVFSLPTNVSLPIEIVNFSAAYANNATTLKWTASNTNGTAHFNIGRKVNDEPYKTIGSINANDKGQISNYSFIDYERKRGILYYQLEIVEQDGGKHYSKIVSVNRTEETVYSVFPNPAHNKVTISGESINQIDIIDNTGRLLIRKRYAVIAGNSNNNIEMDVHELKTGIYCIRIYNLDGTSSTEKMVINQ